MEITFIPLNYDPLEVGGKNYVKVIGRSKEGKRVCLVDEFDISFYCILSERVSDKKAKEILEEINKIKLKEKDGEIKVRKTVLEDKKFLGHDVRAIRVFVNNYRDINKIVEKLDSKDIDKIRENDIGFITKYILERKLIPMQWHKISGQLIGEGEFGGVSEIEADIVLKVEKITSLEERKEEHFNPKVLAFDIETDEFEVGKGDILMISLVSEEFKKVLTWKKVAKAYDHVEHYNDEKQMLEAFVKHFKKINPDIVVGYFSDAFDLPYLKARALKNKIKLGLGLDDSEIKFSGGNSPKGRIFGIPHIDLFQFIETAYSQYLQSETLSLGEVSNELLGERKKDYEFKPSSKMKSDDWERFFEYNLQDSVLTYKLLVKLWPDLMEFSRVMQEPLFNVSRDGMSANVENYIIHNIRKYNEIIEEKPKHEEISKRINREKYEGAFVLQPNPKLYSNIAMFDFTSYWPSIISTFNLSRSTYLGTKKVKDALEVEAEFNGKKKFYFFKKKGFFPEMLGEIIQLRKQYKDEYKKDPSPILKARSNAFKLLANASYGYQGFFGARYYCPEASAATTSISRDFIKQVISKAEKSGFKAIYSDSVDGKTKITIKKNNQVSEEEIQNLFKNVDDKNLSGKEYNYKENIEVLTLNKQGKSVFKKINYVMRHNCDKKVYRVFFTNNWYIDVTEDHSLIGYERIKNNNLKNISERLIEVKPSEIKKKVNSIVCLKKIPYVASISKNYPQKIYEFMGYFVGDGSFMRNKSYDKYHKDYYLRLSLGKDCEEIIKRLIEPLVKLGFIKNYWLSKSREGDITINGLRLVDIISKNFGGENGKKIIPDWLFQETEENIASFLRGLFSADGCVLIINNTPIIKYTSIYEDYIFKVRQLLYRVGISHSVFKEGKVNIYKTKTKKYSSGSFSKNILLKNREQFVQNVGFLLERKNKLMKIKTNPNKTKYVKDFEFDLQSVKKIELISTPKYVYDLEVDETHCFFANYILAHNTDSIALEMNRRTKKEALEFLDKINKDLPGIMEIELEDFYERGIWVTTRKGDFGAKKKYALINWDGKMKIRGFETVRRDWCNLARELQNKVLEMILKNGDEKEALEYTKKIILDIKKRNVEKKKLIIRTQLKKSISEYKAITPHVTIARKMLELGMPVDQGMLIEYYIAESEDKKALKRDRAVFPDDTKAYDIDYYLTRQVLPAVENIFQVFNVNANEMTERKKQKKLLDF